MYMYMLHVYLGIKDRASPYIEVFLHRLKLFWKSRSQHGLLKSKEKIGDQIPMHF